VSLEDADVGEEVLLFSYEHLAGQTPYRSAGAIFIRPSATRRICAVDEVPLSLQRRVLSVRAYDSTGMMLDADVTDGRIVGPCINRFFANTAVAFIHLHNAKPGCFAARVDRA
jgi:hypothetical protein